MTAEQISDAARREVDYIRQAYEGKKADHMVRGVQMMRARLLDMLAKEPA